jgi:hypothetical protein
MARGILSFLIVMTALLSPGFFIGCEKAPQAPPQVIGERELYVFTPDSHYIVGNPEPFSMSPSTSLKDALDSLGKHLAETYFKRTYTDRLTDIHFEVVRIDEIPTPSRPLRIATVNILDANKDVVRYFFQGSGGGQTTFYMLAATFMQPHSSPPFLDGLVLLYNGEALPEFDHINVTGILIPRLVQHAVKRAIQGTKK